MTPPQESKEPLTPLSFQIISEILSWIPPEKVQRFRQLSKPFNTLMLESIDFATKNMSRVLQTQNQQHQQQSFTTTPRFYDQAFFQITSESYQTVYCQQYLKPFKRIQWLNLAANRQIPNAIDNLENIETLCLSHCQLTGEIPTALTKLQTLKYLDLRWNRLQGRIPTEFANLLLLKELWLLQNQLDGEIPKELGTLKHLSVLALSHNKLSGGIPKELGALESLVILVFGWE
ncbi:hypothetical protein BDR26DRAFT_851289 [Obelidium mucronatum]|nr:hypothetical protein BDR26DRAFT_851289 [Obelidium mucronatum]